MKIKHRYSDFRVTELLEDGVIGGEGHFSVYRVTKRRLSTDEAIRELANLVGTEISEIGVAGLKDRQGITTQHMSAPGRVKKRLDRNGLKIEHVGFARRELDSRDSRGNAFHIAARAVDRRELSILRKNLPIVREHGVTNYFDDQRFGNLRHQQGWIARDLMQGKTEEALSKLIAAPSPFDDDRHQSFKSAVSRYWGDWRACRDAAGRFGAHHSVFEHLGSSDGDFAGAFRRVSRRLRLIHLYAYQSHVWNRAVALRLRELVPVGSRVVVESIEGPLVCFEVAPPAELGETFRLPGPGLADVAVEAQRAALADVLAEEGLAPDAFRIDGVSGFQLKGEDRAVVVQPRHLRVRPAADDPDHPGLATVSLRFELPRGSYASLVVKRLFARGIREQDERGRHQNQRGDGRHGGQDRGQRQPYRGRRPDSRKPGGAGGGGHRRDSGSKRGRFESTKGEK